MTLSKKAIEEFKVIYLKEFGEEISDARAEEMGLNLLRLFQLISRPLPHEPLHDCPIHHGILSSRDG